MALSSTSLIAVTIEENRCWELTAALKLEETSNAINGGLGQKMLA